MSGVGGERFTYTEKSGIGGVLMLLGMVIAVEGLALHLMLPRWGSLASAVLDVYAVYWLVALHRSTRKRPVTLDDDALVVNVGSLWTLRVARSAIAGVDATTEGAAKLAFAVAPNVCVRTNTPLTARGLAGLTRTASAFAFFVDEPEALMSALRD
jgi:hypothetical protein